MKPNYWCGTTHQRHSRSPRLEPWGVVTGLYVWTSRDNARDLLRSLPAAARPWWRTWLPIAALVALSLLYVIAAGPDWGSLFIFTSAIVAGRLPPLQGLLIVVALMLVVAIGGALSHTDWSLLSQGLALTFFVGVTVITSMRAIAGTIRANRTQRAAREELARLAVAEERLRFARDLHDLLGHTLSLIALKSELAGRLVRTAPERAEAEVGDVEAAARTALHEVREAVAGYRQSTLERELHAAAEILTAAGIVCAATGELPALPADVEAALSWTVREGVTNVIRHSWARHCAITMRRDVGSVAVQISDDGRASPLARASYSAHSGVDSAVGSGLRGLAERMRALGDTLEAGPGPSGGFRLAVSLPVDADAAPVGVTPTYHQAGGSSEPTGERAGV